jgi:hypothetical protein
MKFVKGNANKGNSVVHDRKKRAHNPRSVIPESEVVTRQMTEQDWIRFYENKRKSK